VTGDSFEWVCDSIREGGGNGVPEWVVFEEEAQYGRGFVLDDDVSRRRPKLLCAGFTRMN
jgi:hypothetical protein